MMQNKKPLRVRGFFMIILAKNKVVSSLKIKFKLVFLNHD